MRTKKHLRGAIASGALVGNVQGRSARGWQPAATLWGVGVAIAVMAIPAQAQTPQAVAFDIPAQPLAGALRLFSQQAKQQVLFDQATVTGRSAPAVHGSRTPRQALEQLLAGTGITFVQSQPDAFTLRPVTTDNEHTSRPTLAVVTVTEQAEVTTQTEHSGSYGVQSVDYGKSAKSLREIPQSLTVITRQRMDDQAMTSASDALRETAGVTVESNWYDGNIYSRGLMVKNVRYDDGAATILRQYSNSSGALSRDLAQFDNLTLLRGADGMFGAGEAGGVINLNHKKPLAERQIKLNAMAGSWNDYRAEFDVTNKLDEDGRVRGRMVAVYHDKDGFNKPNHQRRNMLYGALEVDLAPDTLLSLGVSNQKDENKGGDLGVPRYSDGSNLNLTRRQGLGAPWSRRDSELTTVFARLEHRLSQDWKARLSVTYDKNNYERNYASAMGPIEPVTGSGGNWWGSQWEGMQKNLAIDTNLTGAFNAWGRKHDVVFGLDHVRYYSSDAQNYASSQFGDERLTDIFNPVAPAELSWDPSTFPSTSIINVRKTGFYGSLRLRPIENWSVIAGGRYVLRDKTHMDQTYYSPLDSTISKDENVFVPYAGLIYDITSDLNVYASAAQIHQSQATYLSGPAPGTPLDPTRGTNFELGSKWQVAKDLLASVALYRVEKKGMAVADTNYSSFTGDGNSSCCYVRDGYQLSQGIDLEINGALTPQWQFSLGYTYNDNVDKRKNDARFSTVTPRHLFKLWTDYRFNGTLTGLRLGGGVIVQSSYYSAGAVNLYNPATGLYDGESQNYQFTQGGYAVWSVRGQYVFDRRWSLAVNLNNLFDKTYFSTVGDTASYNYYGAPRNVMVTLRMTL